jgi:hypothetical protein
MIIRYILLPIDRLYRAKTYIIRANYFDAYSNFYMLSCLLSYVNSNIEYPTHSISSTKVIMVATYLLNNVCLQKKAMGHGETLFSPWPIAAGILVLQIQKPWQRLLICQGFHRLFC